MFQFFNPLQFLADLPTKVHEPFIPEPTLVFYMLVGLPGTGKSRWCKEQIEAYWHVCNPVVLSSDDLIEEEAKRLGLTYSDVFRDHISLAERQVLLKATEAFKNNQHVIWDQTNLSKAARAKKLKMVPAHYHKICYVFETPDEETHRERLDGRPGKTIPPAIVNHMKQRYEQPMLAEGFQNVVLVRTF
jgi:predicted kinase